MAKKKYYVVWEGRKPGIYESWADCQKQVQGFSGARFKSYPSKGEAQKAFGEEKSSTGNRAVISEKGNTSHPYIEDSISVDVGSHGNPGLVEYKGVHTKTGEVVFIHEGIEKGTNNMGEFLAIVHALAFLKDKESNIPVYSDSQTAMKWVKEKKVKSTLKREKETEEMWSLVERAESWLKQNTYTNPILKWNTKEWGEIKADYGRKS
ncbi:ribonuclease H [Thalassorhabdus alkalitolerans]|uniref:Ribonuclease H n=1 Tax=Thalassorhabdus alkalitolerans TaxID=2282697 RepID=A0ABW0YL99_9BACI